MSKFLIIVKVYFFTEKIGIIFAPSLCWPSFVGSDGTGLDTALARWCYAIEEYTVPCTSEDAF